MRRKFLVATVVVALVALASPVLAESAHSRASSPAQGLSVADLLGTLQAWLEAIWPQNGCTIDPDGRTTCTVPPSGSQGSSTTRNGCTIDPSGNMVCISRAGLRRGARAPNSCGIDPDGAIHCP